MFLNLIKVASAYSFVSNQFLRNDATDFLAVKENQGKKRNLLHIHMQSGDLHGNSTELQYFYVDTYFGSQRQKQSLIVDTGSSIAAIPCKSYCKSSSCGKHINDHYDFDKSTAKKTY